MIKKCPECNQYTLKDEHCTDTEAAMPPKFSFPDRYGKYRRKTKQQIEGEQE